jgi:hypothetical protein
MSTESDVSLATIAAMLTRLHRVKDRIYRDAWRRRGELIGIFANIARKYDRLEVAASEADAESVESRADTAADLAVYAAKYLTWLIEHDPSLAADFDADPTAWSAARGHDALCAVLKDLDSAEQKRRVPPPADLDAALVAVSEPFRQLEESLVAGAALDPTVKAELVWRLSDGATRYLWRLARDQPDAWARFANEVSALG